MKDLSQTNGPTQNSNLDEMLQAKVGGNIFPDYFSFLRSITQELGMERSFYAIDFADVMRKIELWKKKMPLIHPYYAVKTNSDPLLLQLLVLLGFGFDCASEGEMRLVLESGARASQIVFAHVVKTVGALRFAAEAGVNFLTFDDDAEVEKITKHHPNAKLLLRVAPQSVTCSFDLSDKFGCDVDQAKSILRSLDEKVRENVIGFSFHVGGLCSNPGSYVSTLRACKELFDFGRELGYNFTTLDIGGGFIGEKGKEDIFIETSKAIKSTIDELFSADDIQVIAEPGTFFIGSAVTLTTAICGKKIIHNKKGAEDIERYYYLNDGVYGSFFHGFEQYGCRPRALLDDPDSRSTHQSRLFGQSCCGEDMVSERVRLPDLNIGEFINWENAGAYCRMICSNFCGAPIPDTRYVYVLGNRLDLDWLQNAEDVANFLSMRCALVQGSQQSS